MSAVCNNYRDTQPQDSKLSRLLWCGRVDFKFHSSAVSQRLSGPSPLINRKGNKTPLKLSDLPKDRIDN